MTRSGFDSTWALRREGYRFGLTRFERHGTDGFTTRLLLRRVAVVRGARAAETFYNPRRFHRAGAMPRRIQRAFVGEGGVQHLDGEAHRRRKATLMAVMSPDELDRIEAITEAAWADAIYDWTERDGVVLLEATSRLLCRAACQWVGVDLPPADVDRRTAELMAMIDSPAAVGRRHRRGRRARRSCERWIEPQVEAAGDGRRPIDVIARGVRAEPELDARSARHIGAVEVINLLRPIVAIGRYVAFAAAALLEHPTWRDRVRDDPAWVTAFVHEVRRMSPFFPFVGARASVDGEIAGERVRRGDLVLLDLFATNMDPHRWHRPGEFDPRRHQQREMTAFELIPQGGGDHHRHHRCAGEWMTIRLVEQAVDQLLFGMAYDVPAQDYGVPLDRIPTAPHSGIVLTHVVALTPHRRVSERPRHTGRSPAARVERAHVVPGSANA